jgi:hypothetical protein
VPRKRLICMAYPESPAITRTDSCHRGLAGQGEEHYHSIQMNRKEDLSDSELQQLITPFSERLLELCSLSRRPEMAEAIRTPLYVGKVLSYSTRLEEFIDFCGAKHNQHWVPSRDSLAAIKLISNLSNIVMHIRSACPHYSLLENISSFLEETDEQLDILRNAWLASLDQLSRLGELHRLRVGDDYQQPDFTVRLPETKLPGDLDKIAVSEPEAVVVNMATSFLNLFTETEILNLCDEDPDTYPAYIPDQIDETSLRNLEVQFHNLQSVYDTRLASSNIESVDSRLPLIRGHASIIFHLLEAATHLIHYYERHMAGCIAVDDGVFCPISPRDILGVVFRYCLKYADDFLSSSISLCREVIASYAEQGEIEVPVPRYRGFHVRPSTLVAKIVQHYGSSVMLSLDDMEINAGQPLELFRVNEKINAQKRKSVAGVVCTLDIADLPPGLGDPTDIARAGLRELMDRQLIVGYQQPVELPDLTKAPDEAAVEYMNRVIAQLLAEGKIDIRTDLTIRFTGDKRVLHDLRILAENGYGEDDFGNNIMLPKELSYLKR